MPVTRDEVLEFLGKVDPDSDEGEALLEDLSKKAKPVWSAIYAVAATREEKKATKAAAKMKADLDEATRERDEAKEALRKATDANPDLKKLAEDAQRERAALETKLAKATERLTKAERKVAEAEFVRVATDPKGGNLREPYARSQFVTLVAEGRIGFDEDGKLEVLDEDGHAITPPKGKTVWHPLAEELRKGAEPIFIQGQGDAGSDTGRDRAGGAGGSEYDRIRKEEADRQKERRTGGEAGSYAERLGLAPKA